MAQDPCRTGADVFELDRREFARGTLGTLLTYSLLESLSATDAMGKEVQPIAAKWLAKLDAKSQELRGKELTQLQWQAEIEKLMTQVPLADLLKYVDFERWISELKFRDRGERAFRPQFPKVEGLPTQLVFGHQIFALKKDRSVVPHGHNNMATAFLILDGEFRGRHYDRLEEDDGHMIIRPTINRQFKVGEYSTVSDFRDNVHWFKATSDKAYIFNIHVLNVDPEVKKRGRVYVDPDGEELSDNRIRAEKIKTAEAYKRYG